MILNALPHESYAKGGNSFNPENVPGYGSILLDCKTRVNFLKKKWFVRSNVPQLDQGPVGICYSHAAASYLDVWRELNLNNNTKVYDLRLSRADKISRRRNVRFSQLRLKKRIGQTDPHWLAYLFKKHFDKKHTADLDSGHSELPLIILLRGIQGSCKENVMRSSLKRFTKKGKYLVSVRDFYAFTQWLMKNYDSDMGKTLDKIEKWDDAVFESVWVKYIKGHKIKKLRENGDFEAIYKSLKPHFKGKNYVKYFEEVFSECLDRKNQYSEMRSRQFRNHKICKVKETNQIKQIKNISNLLLDKKPVGFYYFAKILRDKGIIKDPEKVKTDHASVIAGQRVRHNRCQFLVKNSWGNYCKYAWECQKDSLGNELGAWIDAYDLVSQAPRLFYLNKKSDPCLK